MVPIDMVDRAMAHTSKLVSMADKLALDRLVEGGRGRLVEYMHWQCNRLLSLAAIHNSRSSRCMGQPICFTTRMGRASRIAMGSRRRASDMLLYQRASQASSMVADS